MKRQLFQLLCVSGLAWFLSGCHMLPMMEGIKGSGQSETEKRPVTEFREVELGGAMQLELTLGTAPSLEITTDDNLLPLVKTEVKDGRLVISTSESYSTNLGVKIRATTPTLVQLKGQGATHAKVSGLKEKDFSLSLQGASRAAIQGEVDQVRLDLQGASRFQGAELRAASMVAELSGASQAEVQVSNALKVNASGASALRYLGSPTSIEKVVSGASKVSAKE